MAKKKLEDILIPKKENTTSKTWTAWVTVYHKFEVEADTYQEARERATEEIWDDHINMVDIRLEEDMNDGS